MPLRRGAEDDVSPYAENSGAGLRDVGRLTAPSGANGAVLP